MALPPPTLTRQCPEPPFNDPPVTPERRFSLAWAQYFTDVHDWMEASEGALLARAQAAEARLALLEARLTAAGL